MVGFYSVWAALIRQVAEAAGIASAGAACDADKVRSEERAPLKSLLFKSTRVGRAHGWAAHTGAVADFEN